MRGYRVWAEIDLAALRHNIGLIRRALEPAKSSATKSSKPIRHRRFQPLTTWPRFSALAGPALERPSTHFSSQVSHDSRSG